MDQIISFQTNMAAAIDLAMMMGGVNVFRSITVTNNSNQKLENIRLKIAFEPDFAMTFESAEFTLEPERPTEITPINAALDRDMLFTLTEPSKGYARIEALRGEEVLGRQLVEISLLPWDHFTGTRLMPETAAAFVVPSDQAVARVMERAAQRLEKTSSEGAFTGYNSRSTALVQQQMAAIFEAIKEQNIGMEDMKVSCQEPQQVRMPENVIGKGMANPLEMALLYCSCLEKAGLNGLLILSQRGASAGCWLEPQTFSDAIQYDSTAILKRTAKGIDLIATVDCTEACAGRSGNFATAKRSAEQMLNSSRDFELALDIARARAAGMATINSETSQNGVSTPFNTGQQNSANSNSNLNENEFISGDQPQKQVTKQMIWERKLLDMTLRNSLLNFRCTSSSVQLMVNDLSTLEDEISFGEEFEILPIPQDTAIEPVNSSIYAIENDYEAIANIAVNEFKSARLRTFLKDSDLERSMKKLHRAAKLSIEENGANTIYLALGFLKWFETEKADKERFAPLVLVPIDIIKHNQAKSFSIKIRDEESQVNITLLEMLRQAYGVEIQGLDPIPLDEKGADLTKIFAAVRQAILEKPRWNVVEYAFLGQFSFNRFIMYNDIRNRSQELASNKVVASLIAGETTWKGENIAVSPLELDKNIKPSEIAAPVAADSSQLAAVVASAQGKSFVLHGPPGTGKSQTITNMIANALYSGKSVLFVAEKMAALSVVEKRLNKIGLGEFCLELHSNKAQKRAVLNQLDETLNVGRIKKTEEYQAQAQRLYELRMKLNSTMEELYKPRNFGLSVCDAAAVWEREPTLCGVLEFTDELIEQMQPKTFSQWKDQLQSLVAMTSEFGEPKDSPLVICKLRECTPDTREQLGDLLDSFSANISNVKDSLDKLSEMCGASNIGYVMYSTLAGVVSETLSSSGILLNKVLENGDWEVVKSGAMQLCECGAKYDQLKPDVLTEYEDSVLDYNVKDAQIRWKKAQTRWFLSKHFALKKLVNELSIHAKDPSKIDKQNLGEQYQKLIEIYELREQIKDAKPINTQFFGSLWQGMDTDWQMLSNSLKLSDSIRNKLIRSGLDNTQRSAFLQKLCTDLGSIELKTANNVLYSNLDSNFKTLDNIINELSEKLKFDTELLMSGEDWISSSKEKIAEIKNELGRLKEWCVINSISEELRSSGIGNVVQALFDGKVTTDTLIPTFEADLCRKMVMHTISNSPQLSSFQGNMFEETIRKCGEVQDNFRKLTIQEVAAKLSANVPAPGESAKSSELGVLQRAIKSGGRMMPIRKLFDSIPNLLRRICPCMLMSPISVAQYIDPSFPKFDLVIFDEASQLPTCEAVGAIARGENVIVVGDPKQLPPTSFFNANQSDDENFEKEDLESVLDDCLALNMPQMHLLWHYRSRHESLIAYSNAKYYENKLYTFPSPDDRISKVSWVKVEGFYDRSSSKVNRAEAMAIVEEICRRLRNSELRKHSIGVVTFSLVQQNLIDDMLSDAFAKDPELENIAENMYEPILIKNLENVQGDERDVIFFSIGYGPDKEGKVSMNFGPLNRDGGWRRLNVAISRSREEMVVYSVITPEMIDLSRTSSEGVEGLKGFLEFAARGTKALPVRVGTKANENAFANVVAAALEEKGYKAQTNVGCSNYKIDVAVADPEEQERYILAINCGSKEHFVNSTAYDRHISQPSVLRGLGWNTENVYIIDWLDNKEQVLKNLEEAVNTALERKHAPVVEEEISPSAKIVFEKEAALQLTDLCAEYVPFTTIDLGDSEGFTETNKSKISDCINKVVSAEAPMSKDLLSKKVYSCWGISRAGASMKRLFDSALLESGVQVVMGVQGDFIWKKDEKPQDYALCRTKYPEGVRRDIADIAPEELGVGVALIMSRQTAMTRDDLLRETAHLFGFTRMTPALENALAFGIRAAKLGGKIDFDEEGKIVFVG